MCLLLGATGVGKSLLLSSRDGKGDLGDPPPTRPTVGTNLTDIVAQKKITIRELGGCMGPIWSSYYGNCHSLLFMVDASNPTQLSASCVQLLGLLSAEELAKASVLILFNKISTAKSPLSKVLPAFIIILRSQDIERKTSRNQSALDIFSHPIHLSSVLPLLSDGTPGNQFFQVSLLIGSEKQLSRLGMNFLYWSYILSAQPQYY
ncbi:ADP-ribosylation factor-like protein 16 isoform X2 [Bos indicus x Bos taurus]|uniref:ADP-ribosylation factor-like protein 16 isoform X2 n=1 Tax=Bos indicus x Bos taurus TaxID=30522 RepID=UPI000F7D31B7|nr:ADP-ribosylation factor-like protein 16 isoform X2 [Bos indicus x Bos taurus]